MNGGAALPRRFLRNRAAALGSLVLLAVVAVALLADVIAPRDPLRMVARPELWPFTDPRFPLGTDALGRDIMAIIVHGARTAIGIGVLAAAISTTVGIAVGAAAGYFRGWIDDLLMRFTEVLQTIPNLVIVLALVAVVGPDIVYVVLAIGLVSWTSVARMVRGEFLALREREFVLACRAAGMGDLRIMLREILPNALPPVIVYASFLVSAAILFEAALAFLGLSDPSIASWGRLIGEGRQTLRTSWFIAAIPGVAIVLTVLALNLVGDGLNDALNPRLRDQ
ncbi:MAG: ABC transporter permease [Alphaproteobacteria bacterium]|nr:ABC transporter permease [Alphaproteobacteria bacterium]